MCFRGRSDRIRDELNVEGNGEREESGETPRSLFSKWKN